MTFCGRCGEKNPDDSRFCWKCGAMLLHEPERAEGVRDVEHVHRPARDPHLQDSSTVRTERARPVEKVEPVYRQDPKFKPGYTMVDDHTVGFGTKTYDISPNVISNFRTCGIICIILTYIIGFYMFFGYQITYDGGLSGAQMTLFDVATGDYMTVFPVDILIYAGIIAVLFSFTAYGSMAAALMGLYSLIASSRLETDTDIIIGTLNTTYTADFESSLILPLILFIVGAIAATCISRATIPYTMTVGSTSLGAISNFFTGSK